MKLLFKDTTFPELARDLLGFLDADIELKYMRSDIRSATKEIIKLVGNEIYEMAVSAFEKEEPTPLELELVEYFQLPILLNAYRLYAPTNDLRHSNDGRKMRNTNNEANPFQWMIDRDNENLERKYYRYVNDLISYLSKFDKFIQTIFYQNSRKLLVYSSDVFDEHFPINSRLLHLKLSPGLKKAENQKLIPILGENLFQKLKQSIKEDYPEEIEYYPDEAPTNQPEPEEEEEAPKLTHIEREILEKCQEACVYYSLSWAMKRLSVQLFPEGVLQQYVGDRNNTISKKTPEFMQSQLAAQEFSKDAEDVFFTLQTLVAEIQETTEVDSIKLIKDFQNEAKNKFFST